MAFRSVVMGLVVLARAAAAAPDMAQAKAHFEAGRAYYEAERWADAAREFQEAYRLSNHPDLLLDMARAETRNGQEEAAILHLEQYAAARPDASDAASVSAEAAARRATLQQRAAATKAQEEAERDRQQAERDRAERTRVEARLAVRPKWPGITLIAGGAALGAVGIGLGVTAIGDANTVSNGGARDPDMGSIDWVSAHDGRYPAAQSAGKRNAVAGIVLDAVGVAAIGSGVGLLVWALRGPRGERRVWLKPMPSGLLAGASY